MNDLDEMRIRTIDLTPDDTLKGGVLHDSLRTRIKYKLRNAVITIAMLTSLLGPMSNTLAAAASQDPESAIELQSKESADRVADLIKQIKLCWSKEEYDSADTKIKLLFAFADSTKDQALKKNAEEYAQIQILMLSIQAVKQGRLSDSFKLIRSVELWSMQNNSSYILREAQDLRFRFKEHIGIEKKDSGSESLVVGKGSFEINYEIQSSIIIEKEYVAFVVTMSWTTKFGMPESIEKFVKEKMQECMKENYKLKIGTRMIEYTPMGSIGGQNTARTIIRLR